MKNKKIVISVSRRTDIPAYYADWFRKRLEIGNTFYPNPMNPNQIVEQKLTPESVKAFVFWTRNPKPLFRHLDYIDKKYYKKHYMHFTINGLPEALELRNPKIQFAVDSVKYLSDRYKSNQYAQWRYDPIVISSISEYEYHLEKFSEIANLLSGYVDRCYFSFVDLYSKTKRNFNKISDSKKITFRTPPIEERIRLINDFIGIAEPLSIKLYACAEDDIYNLITNVEKAHCVDGDIIDRICLDDSQSNYSIKPSRIGCGCIDSKDIGYYDSCPHGCIYCYANMNPEMALENAKTYLKDGFPLDATRKNNNESENQTNLFE